MSAPKKPSDTKSSATQGSSSKRSSKSKPQPDTTANQHAASGQEAQKRAPGAKTSNARKAEKKANLVQSEPPADADSLPLDILEAVDPNAPLELALPMALDADAPVKLTEPPNTFERQVAGAAALTPEAPPDVAPATVRAATSPHSDSAPPKGPSKTDPVVTPSSAPSKPQAHTPAVGTRIVRDSQPPVPSSLVARPSEVNDDADKLSPMSLRPRTSVRPANYLTAYDLPLDRDSLRLGVANHVEYTQGKDEFSATQLDYFMAAAYATRDRLFDRWNKTQQHYYRKDQRRVYYLSMEFLLGRLFEDSLLNLGIRDAMNQALGELGIETSELAEAEYDAGLGNGGLGRLAACLLDSMATVGLPGMGYGMRYEYGIFEQQIVNGRQIERADNWLRYGNPWEVARPEQRYLVRFGGRVVEAPDHVGRFTFNWIDTEDVWAMAYDVLVPGYGNDVVNTLRLWSARATRGFQFAYFNDGDYIKAVEDKNATENISRVLYPNDMVAQGRELRLKQEYFFVSATLQDALQRHLKTHTSLDTLPEKAVFQLNDTHPALGILELMRLLMDDHGFGWEEAWRITAHSFAYTNHTILPEALECWPVSLLERTLPRHLQIAYEINRRFLEDVRARFPGDEARVTRMSLFAEQPEKRLRMAHLCVVGAKYVNGVSELHSRILCDKLFFDFAAMWPHKFKSVTNGITPRRWLLKCNPPLTALVNATIGERWVTDLGELEKLAAHATDAGFRAAFREAKHKNKVRLSNVLKRLHGLDVDPNSMLDVQVKRIHEYKRQLLNILHVAFLYLNYRVRPPSDMQPRTFLFAGKAAPGYAMAKLIIEFIIAVGDTIAADPATRDLLRVCFMPNYSVSLAELVIPAAEVSEQISLAGTEASGTGNMKLALNGALTLGTLDGATVEIAESVGHEQIFIFGLTAPEVEGVRARGYRPREIYQADAEIRTVIDAIAAGVFSRGDRLRFMPIVDSLLSEDRYLVLADFQSYRSCHDAVLRAYARREEWTRHSIMNTAKMGRFSSDQVIRNYARDIWEVNV
jgi:starch phosphorylase